MSILTKILQDMYVAPDILAELDDEKKQVLFCKMREEQLRRWTTREKEWEEKERLKNSSSTENGSSSSGESGKKVRWRLGGDGNPWVWVMGEHADDKTIEEIVEEEIQEKARRLAEEEAEELRSLREEELKEKLRQEQLEAEEERMKMERERQMAAAQQAQEEEAVRRRIEQAKAKKLLENEQSEAAAILSRQAEEDHLKRELQQQQHEQFGQWHDNGEEVAVERRVRATDLNDQELVERRRSEIYQTLTEARERANREAEKEAEEERRYWEEQERKARDAEDQIRSIARRAREQHKEHSLRTSTSLLSLLKMEAQAQRKQPQSPKLQQCDAADGLLTAAINDSSGSGSSSPALAINHVSNTAMKLPRPPKPQSREAIIQWYLKEELASGNGLEQGSSRFAPWFHGIIGREEAEQLLTPPRPAGAFLVRVSARIWGYAISYKVDDISNCVKHFLIEKVTENGTAGYQLYGTNQLVHGSLWDLVTYHKTAPITVKGGEMLKEPVGQVRFPPDYQELLGFGNSSNGRSAGPDNTQFRTQRL